MKKIPTKQHQKLVCYIMCFLLFALSGCSLQQENVSVNKLPIAQVREQMESDMEELKNGVYENLSCEKFTPDFPESDEWHNLHIIDGEGACGKKGTELAQVMRNNFDTTKKIIGSEMNNQYIRFVFDEFGDKVKYEEKLLEQIENGKYDNKRYNGIMYESDEKDPAGCFYFWMDWKQADIHFRSGIFEKYPELIDSAENIQIKETYYNTCGQEDRKQAYTLCDGNKVSIEEAMNMAEVYLKDNFTGKLPMKIKRIDVAEIGENKYEYIISFVTDWKGIGFDVNGSLSKESRKAQVNREISYNTKVLYILGRNETGDYVNLGQNKNIEETGDGITNILTLKQALELVSESVGTTSVYQIRNVGIAYRVVIDKQDAVESNEYSAYPVWEIETVNQSDKKETRFYVNVADGTLEVDIFE